MDAAFTQLLTTPRFPRTGSPEHPRGLGLVSSHCSVRPNAGASRAHSDLVSRVFYLRKKQTPHPLPTKSLLEVPFFLHYPIFRLLFPSLSKRTRSFKDLNKESSLSRVLQLRGKKRLTEIWGKPPDGQFSKCGPRIPGEPSLSGGSPGSPFSNCRAVGGWASLQISTQPNRREQIEADMRLSCWQDLPTRKQGAEDLHEWKAMLLLSLNVMLPQKMEHFQIQIFMLTHKGYITAIFKWVGKIFFKFLGFCFSAVNMSR